MASAVDVPTVLGLAVISLILLLFAATLNVDGACAVMSAESALSDVTLSLNGHQVSALYGSKRLKT